MKQMVQNSVQASCHDAAGKMIFTPEEVVEFLSVIVELDEYPVSLVSSSKCSAEIRVGDSLYQVFDDDPQAESN